MQDKIQRNTLSLSPRWSMKNFFFVSIRWEDDGSLFVSNLLSFDGHLKQANNDEIERFENKWRRIWIWKVFSFLFLNNNII